MFTAHRKIVGLGFALACAVVLASSTSPSAQGSQTYVVLYTGNTVPGDAARVIAASGGTLVAAYAPIGVAIASSGSDAFRTNLLVQGGVAGVSATQGFGTQLRDDDLQQAQSGADALLNSPVADSDPLSGLQWDMRQIHTPGAHAITGGSPTVLVGDLDSGLDYTHPDLRANIWSASAPFGVTIAGRTITCRNTKIRRSIATAFCHSRRMDDAPVRRRSSCRSLYR